MFLSGGGTAVGSGGEKILLECECGEKLDNISSVVTFGIDD